MEVEGEAGVATRRAKSSAPSLVGQNRESLGTHYFSMSTREALFVVLVRTRPYIFYPESVSARFNTPSSRRRERVADHFDVVLRRRKGR